MAEPLRWEPAIYEHKAALIGRAPTEVASSSELLHQALMEEHRIYQASFLTVGVDVYNLEAEACGAKVIPVSPVSCPEIPDHLWKIDSLPEELVLPDIPEAGRFRILLDAARKLRESLCDTGEGTPVIRVAASGPVSIAAKLVGTEPLLIGLMIEEPPAKRLLEFCTEVAESWLTAVRDAGLEVIVFDSTASPPMFSPDLYKTKVFPLHTRLMEVLEKRGQVNRPLILGGNTSGIAANLIQSGANQLICDYAADPVEFSRAISDIDDRVTVRLNLNPAVLSGQGEDTGYLQKAADKYSTELALFPRVVAGTGILPYDQDPGRYQELRSAVEGIRNRR